VLKAGRNATRRMMSSATPIIKIIVHRNLHVRFYLVAVVGFEPTTFGL
jgi:hypothetical protein